MMKIVLFFAAVFCLVSAVICDKPCPQHCSCRRSKRSDHYIVLCKAKDDELIKPKNFTTANSSSYEKCKQVVSFSDVTPKAQEISIDCYKLLNISALHRLNRLTSIVLTRTNLTTISLDLFTKNPLLKQLDVSHNEIVEVVASDNTVFRSLLTVNLSGNRIKKLHWSGQSFPSLRSLHIQNNQLQSSSQINKLSSLSYLDISSNSFGRNFNLSGLDNLTTLVMQNISIAAAKRTCKDCILLPTGLQTLYLQGNSLLHVPSCYGLLAGLSNLTHLYLQNNAISIISANTFKSYCFSKLNVVSLADNRLIQIDADALDTLGSLQQLDIRNNYLQHLSPKLLKTVVGSSNRQVPGNITFDGNRWSCDCQLVSLHSWLNSVNGVPLKFICNHPPLLKGKLLAPLKTTQLTCKESTWMIIRNATAQEYYSGNLACISSGVPKPRVYWLSPSNELISLESLAGNTTQRDQYSLSDYGDILTVKNVQLHKTGFYRCFADNGFSVANNTASLSVVLSQTSTVILLAVVCTAFMIAVVVNSINMCLYICEHLEKKRLYKKALQAQKEEEKLNPPITCRSKVLDESIASLNANRHYGKYDFTCQQMFLDTVVKGAHTVKKTLYDARHSEFSNNMWEYAANLRDRLHIEIPSGVQLPSISMPSISMPSISMPTISMPAMPAMPTMQDINTNIEKLSSSMMQRSHTLATSVGSVFTLRRRMWQTQNNSSDDNDSKDSEENLDEAGITRVTVDVHSTRSHRRQNSDQRRINQSHPSSSKDDSVEVCEKEKFSEVVKRQEADSGDDCNQPAAEESRLLSKIVRFEHSKSPPSHNNQPQAVSLEINSAPNVNTTDAALDGQWHTYETSV